jgi:hypothetical protein
MDQYVTRLISTPSVPFLIDSNLVQTCTKSESIKKERREYISFIWGSSLEVFVLNATGAKQKEKYPFICVGNTLIP